MSGIAAVLSVLAGALASFFTGSIRSFIFLPADPKDGTHFKFAYFHFSWDAFAFFTLIVVAALLFAWSKAADSATANEQQAETDRLLHDLETMPPDSFLAEVRAEYEVVHDLVVTTQQTYYKAPSELSIEQIDLVIRSVLISIARSARAYDGKHGREYLANLMLYTLSPPQEKLKRVLDTDHLASGAVMGYLEGFSQLAVETGSNKTGGVAKAPDNFAEIALPVHRKQDDAGNLIPGGPEALNTGVAVRVPSTVKLVKELEVGYKDQNQVAALKNYFTNGPGKDIGSFFCMPVKRASAPVPQSDDISELGFSAVINLHSSERDILSAGTERFWPVVFPFLLLIGILLAMRNALSPTDAVSDQPNGLTGNVSTADNPSS